MDFIFQFAMVVIPLIPIFLMSRILILMCRVFISPLPSILIGNGIAFVAIFVLGAIALSMNGSPDWQRSISLFSVYGVVMLFDIVRMMLQRLENASGAFLPSFTSLGRQTPLARDRRRLRR